MCFYNPLSMPAPAAAATTFSAAARRAAPLLLPVTAAAAAAYAHGSSPNPNAGAGLGSSRCEATSRGQRPHQRMQQLPAVLRKRMTSIGRFSLRSETRENPSIPTFFLALGGAPRLDLRSTTATSAGPSKSWHPDSGGAGMSRAEFEEVWRRREMPSRHPRFHSRVSRGDDRYFEYEAEESSASESESESESEPHRFGAAGGAAGDRIKAELSRHVSETVHPTVYRSDLRMRIERLLTAPMDLTEKLWEVTLSTGLAGSSGAVSRLKAGEMMAEGDEGESGGKEIESLLLFRSHHTLADGVSLISALGDLVDEAEEIREEVRAEIGRRRRRARAGGLLRRWLRSLRKLVWFCLGTIRSLTYQARLFWTTKANPFEEAVPTRLRAPGRSVSWCDAAPLAEAKAVARAVGPGVTVNDVFVACVSAAVARQLREHGERIGLGLEAGGEAAKSPAPPSDINVVVPVHLMGGALLPGKSVGNHIGAFVARVPSCPSDLTSVSPASDRLRAVHSSLDAIKRSPAPLLSYLFARFASDCLPEATAKRLLRSANANAAAVISNSRGFPRTVHINGRGELYSIDFYSGLGEACLVPVA